MFFINCNVSINNVRNSTKEIIDMKVVTCISLEDVVILSMLSSYAFIAVVSLDHTILDGRTIRVDWDTGFEEGRQYGRGHFGGQKRDELNKRHDPERPSEKSDKKYMGHKRRERDFY